MALLVHPKASTSGLFFKSALSEQIECLSPCDVVYTDGSKSDVSTACAFVTANRDYKFALPPAATVFTAELTAILKALSIVCPTTRRLVVCSDSLSSLQVLRDIYSKNILVRDILCAIHTLWARGIEVFFIWVPSHVGIPGNELADEAARSGLDLNPPESILLASDMKPVAKRCMSSSWYASWLGITGNKLRALKDDVLPWETSHRKCRREEVVLCRLRIGHTLLTHGHLMAREDPPVCNTCNTALTVEHILIHCGRYVRLRRANRLPVILRDVLSDSEPLIRKLFKFLNETGLFNTI